MSENSSLKTSIVKWLAAFTLVPLALFVTIELYLTSNEYTARAFERMHSSLTLKKRYIENWFDYRRMDLTSQADDPNVINFMAALNADFDKSQKPLANYVKSPAWKSVTTQYSQELTNFMHDYDYIYDVFLIRQNGDIIFTIAQEDDLGTNLSEGAYAQTLFAGAFKNATMSKGFSFSGIESYAPSFGVKAGFVITPLVNNDHQIIGYLAVQLRLERILKLLSHGNINLNIQEYLVDSDGSVLSEHDNAFVKPKDLTKIAIFSKDHVSSYTNKQGDSVFGIKEPLNVLGIQWFLVGEINKDFVLGSLYRSFLGSLIILILAGIGAVWASRLVAKRITKPISNIIEFTNKHNFNTAEQLPFAENNELKLLEQMLKQTIIARLDYEQVLEQYRTKMELACDAVNIVMFEFYQQGQSLVWDKRGYELFNISPRHQDPLYTLWLQAIEPSERDSVASHIQFAINNLCDIDIEYQLAGTQQRVIRSQAHFQAMGEHQGYWLGIHSDVTAIKQTELSLRATQTFQSLLLRNIPDIFFVKDSEFRIVQANDAFLELYPKSMRDKIIGYTTLENYTTDEQEEFLAQDRKALAEGYAEIEESILFPDGVRRTLLTKKTRFISQDGKPHILGLARDISDLKAQQQALYLTSERYRLAMQVSDGGIWDWDIAANTVYLSEQLKEWLGQASNEVSGAMPELLARHATLDHQTLILKRLDLPFASQQIKFEFALVLNNELTHFLLSALELCDDSGEVVRVIGNLTDISSFKQQQALLELAKAEAERANTLKSGFLATVSHEIRTPLNGVLGTLHLMANTQLSSEQMHYLTLCQNSASSLAQLLNDVLDFEKLGKNKLTLTSQKIDLLNVIEEVCFNHAQNAMAKDVSFLVDDSQVCVRQISSDPIRLKQIMHNLVQNAVKFTNEGSIRVVAKTKQTTTGCRLIFHVIDTGIGMDDTHKDHIFNEFTQLDNTASRNFGGSGLGLSIVAKLVELMCGKISVVSKLNKGSRFSVSIPISCVEPMASVEKNNTKCILLAANRAEYSHVFKQLENVFNTVVWYESALQLSDSKSIGSEQAFCLFIDGALVDENIHQIVAQSMVTFVFGTATFDVSKNSSKTLPKPITGAIIHRALAEFTHYERPVETSKKSDVNTTKRVAIAEDNPVNQLITKALLTRQGIDYIIANNGQELLEKLALSDDVGVILMDCQMPVMDGFSATRAIREGKLSEEYISIPIIALTANAMEGDRERCLAAGMDDYLAKPLNENELLAVLKHYL